VTFQTVYDSHVSSLLADNPASLYQLQCELLQKAREHAGVVESIDDPRVIENKVITQVKAPPPPPPPLSSPGKSTKGLGTRRWDQSEVGSGLMLGRTWAPPEIRVCEWSTPGGMISAAPADDDPRRAWALRELARERESARRTRELRLSLAGYEMGYVPSRKDVAVMGRFREVLGAEGFEVFKQYARKFDAETIPLEGASGLLGHVERLLDTAPTRLVGASERRQLLDDLVRTVRENGC